MVQSALMSFSLLPLGAATIKCIPLSVKIGNSGSNICSDKPVLTYLQIIINFAAGVIGVAVVLAIVISGFQYITSTGNPDAIKSAKKRLGNALLGLVLYLLMYGVLTALGLDIFE